MPVRTALAAVLQVAIGLILSTCPAYCDDASGDEVTIEQIVAAWNARQDRVQSMQFEFTQDLVLVRKDNLQLKTEHELSIDGIRYRYESVGRRWNHMVEDAVQETYLQLFDGESDRSFFGCDERTDRLHPLGRIKLQTLENYYSEAHNNAVWPIFHTFRIRQPAFVESTADAWRLTGHEGRIDGRRCVIVELSKEAEAGRMYELWVDTTRDFVVLRKEMGGNGIVVSRLDIEYDEEAEIGWAPRRWTSNSFTGSGTELVDSYVIEVTSRKFNMPIEESVFEFSFPPGTVVYDDTRGQYSYVVLEDEEREITADERRRGSRYTDWLQSDSGEALLPPGRSNAWLWLLGGAILAVVGWRVLRRKTGTLSLIAIGTISMWSGPAYCDDANADEVTIEQIVAAWNDRQDRVNSMEFEFTREIVMIREGESRLNTDHDLFIDGLRYRHEWMGEKWHSQLELAVDTTCLQLFDGTTDIGFFGYEERTNRLHPIGRLSPPGGHETYYSEAHNNAVWPIFHTFRIRQPWFVEPTPDAWRLTGREGRIEGQRCVIVEYVKSADAGRMYELWVVPARDYVVLRKELGGNGTVVSRLDIEYEKDPDIGWMPRRWTSNTFTNTPSELVDTAVIEVTSHEFNETIDESVFKFTFPPGTEVYDETQGQYTYIAGEDEDREITADERNRGSRYTDWLQSDSGEALLPPGRSNTWLWLLGGAILAVVGWRVLRSKVSAG